MTLIKTIPIAHVDVPDPTTGQQVGVEIRKLETGEVVGLDAAYLDRLDGDPKEVAPLNPYGTGEKLLVPDDEGIVTIESYNCLPPTPRPQHVIVVSPGGISEPILTTTDEDEANQAYKEAIKEHCDEEECEEGMDPDDFVVVDGASYRMVDEYGQTLVQHFVLAADMADGPDASAPTKPPKPICQLGASTEEAVEAFNGIVEALWMEGDSGSDMVLNPDKEWSSDTLEQIRDAIVNAGISTPTQVTPVPWTN